MRTWGRRALVVGYVSEYGEHVRGVWNDGGPLGGPGQDIGPGNVDII